MDKEAKLTLPVRFDYGFHHQFQEFCLKFIEDKTIESIVFDFSRVEYLDSAALGMLMMWQKRVSGANKKVSIHGARGEAEQILIMANMNKIFDIKN